MLWCQGPQNIGLSGRKLKSALTCTIWSQCTPSQTDPIMHILYSDGRVLKSEHTTHNTLDSW